MWRETYWSKECGVPRAMWNELMWAKERGDPAGPEPEPGTRGFQFSLGGLLICIACVTVVIGLLIPALHDARKRSKLTGCKSDLKHLGVYLVTYVSRYGNDVHYPSCSPPAGGTGGGLPGGPNGAFWSHLWRVPASPPVAGSNPRAVASRPGENGLFVCRCHRWMQGYTPYSTNSSLDYSGPDLSRRDLFPGGVLSDHVLPSTYIGGDLVLPGDCNHGQDRHGPNYDFSALRFDGSVHNISPNGGAIGEHKAYLESTNAEDGVRTP